VGKVKNGATAVAQTVFWFLSAGLWVRIAGIIIAAVELWMAVLKNGGIENAFLQPWFGAAVPV